MTLLITNGNLIDRNGATIERAWVAIKDGKIQNIGSGDIQGDFSNYTLIDSTGNTILPGLIDTHVHITMSGHDPQTEAKLKPKDTRILEAVANCKKTLFSGITTIRDQGSFECIDISLRDAIANKLITGPRIICSGRAICATGGHGSTLGGREADGVEEVRKAAREQLKAGADNIKMMASGGCVTEGVEPIHVQFSLMELKTAAEEAKKAGKTITAHAHPAQAIKDCIIAGIYSIQHAIYADDESIEMMAERKIYLSPTLMAPKQAFENKRLTPEWLLKKAETVIPIHYQNIVKAYRAGVNIVMGSDAGAPMVYHGNNLRELSELVAIGMSPHEAILGATKNAAEALGLGDLIGSIERDKIADIILVQGNPIEKISIIQDEKNITTVIKGGEIVKDLRTNKEKIL